jgi:hypothetical protein
MTAHDTVNRPTRLNSNALPDQIRRIPNRGPNGGLSRLSAKVALLRQGDWVEHGAQGFRRPIRSWIACTRSPLRIRPVSWIPNS